MFYYIGNTYMTDYSYFSQSREFIGDDYVIYLDKLIGDGGFSKVYDCKYKGISVAAKVVQIKKMKKRLVSQLDRELEIITILREYPHPNILHYYKIERKSDFTVIIMEKCEGGELKKAINRKLDERTCQNYMRQLIKAYLHLLKHNIMHRDVKPANILLTKKKCIKLIDFGLSKISDDKMEKTWCGSPLYMAPEILYEQDYDKKTDVWSMGIILYEMTYGFTPFNDSMDIKSLKYNIVMKSIPFPNYNLSGGIVSDNCKDFIKCLLRINVKKRIDWSNISKHKWIKRDVRLNQDLLTRPDINGLSMSLPIDTSSNSSYSHESDENKKKKNKEIIQEKAKAEEKAKAKETYNNKMINSISKKLTGNIKYRYGIDDSSSGDKSVMVEKFCADYSDEDDIFQMDGSSLTSTDNIVGAPVIDEYMSGELHEVDDDDIDYTRAIPIKYNNRGRSRLDFIDFQDVSQGRRRSSTREKIVDYVYSRSAPIASNLLNGINSFGKTTKHIIRDMIGTKNK